MPEKSKNQVNSMIKLRKGMTTEELIKVAKAKGRTLKKDEAELILKAQSKELYYKKLTTYIAEHINTAMQVAENLYIVREHKLYKLQYKTFEQYVKNEFDCTRGRAYQLTDAHELAEYINTEIGEQTLKTEPQCRELLKLKVYSDDEHKTFNKEESNKERLALIKQIDGERTPSRIAEKVKVFLDSLTANKKKLPPKEYCLTKVKPSIKSICNRVKYLFKAEDMSDEDKAAFKQSIVDELKKQIEQLEIEASSKNV